MHVVRPVNPYGHMVYVVHCSSQDLATTHELRESMVYVVPRGMGESDIMSCDVTTSVSRYIRAWALK